MNSSPYISAPLFSIGLLLNVVILFVLANSCRPFVSNRLDFIMSLLVSIFIYTSFCGTLDSVFGLVGLPDHFTSKSSQAWLERYLVFCRPSPSHATHFVKIGAMTMVAGVLMITIFATSPSSNSIQPDKPLQFGVWIVLLLTVVVVSLASSIYCYSCMHFASIYLQDSLKKNSAAKSTRILLLRK
ncbi:hypothetical protein BDR26DRAFT_37426 [Obelidium mucronatum]|nr:hypothetical protein BDR26DRAFT_37426 [Obelidium mucronatum]